MRVIAVHTCIAHTVYLGYTDLSHCDVLEVYENHNLITLKDTIIFRPVSTTDQEGKQIEGYGPAMSPGCEAPHPVYLPLSFGFYWPDEEPEGFAKLETFLAKLQESKAE